MTRSVDALSRVAALGILALAILLAGGCNSGGSKRISLYQKLVGKWRIQRVHLDASTISFSERTVRFEFLSQDDGRSYRLSRIAPNDTSTVTGAVQVLESNALSMTGAFSLVWRFNFDKPDDLSDSVRFRLESAREGSVQTFLGAIGLSGGAQSLTVDLVRD